jgi:hypothetical protein
MNQLPTPQFPMNAPSNQFPQSTSGIRQPSSSPSPFSLHGNSPIRPSYPNSNQIPNMTGNKRNVVVVPTGPSNQQNLFNIGKQQTTLESPRNMQQNIYPNKTNNQFFNFRENSLKKSINANQASVQPQPPLSQSL